MTRTADHPPRRIAWALLRMSRPSQLLLVAVVYGLGVAIALAWGAAADPAGVAAGLGALIAVAASIHYANEYADFFADALAVRTPFSGGSGALQRTGLPRGVALLAARASLLAGVGVAVVCLLHGFPLAAVGALLLGAAFGWGYSLPPLALARHGLGELDNAALGGIVLPAYGYAVAAGRVAPRLVLACLPFAAVVFANLLDTTWPDREADAAVGKRTLATRWSPRRLRAAYLAAALASLGGLVALRGGVLPPLVADAGLAVAPLLAWGALRYTRTRSPFPTVAAMVGMAALQLAAWARVAGLV